MQFDAAQIDDPRKSGGIVDHDFFRGSARWKRQRDGSQPIGPLGRRALLIESLAFRAVDESFEDDRTISDSCRAPGATDR